MKTHGTLTGVIVALLGLSVAHGQGPANLPVASGGQVPPVIAGNGRSTLNELGANNVPGADTGTYPGGGQPSGPGGGPPIYGPGITDWLAYPRGCDCCGPVGKHGPIGAELYGRTGVSFLTGGGLVGSNGQAGYFVGGGLRTLFYNKPADAAWVVDMGITSSWHDIMNAPPAELRNVDVLQTQQGQTQQTRVNTPSVIVIASSVHYLLVNATIGREIYLWGAADGACESRFRIGWDLGGSWGSSKMIAAPLNLQPGQIFRHRNDVVGGFLGALHADYEMPTSCCTLFMGGRLEYGAIFSDILQSQNDTNVQMINVLFNIGLRY